MGLKRENSVKQEISKVNKELGDIKKELIKKVATRPQTANIKRKTSISPNNDERVKTKTDSSHTFRFKTFVL